MRPCLKTSGFNFVEPIILHLPITGKKKAKKKENNEQSKTTIENDMSIVYNSNMTITGKEILKMSNERIESIEKKIEQLKAQKQAIVQREKEKERKARTRRLIQIGALFEKYIGIDTVEGTEEWLKEHTGQQKKDQDI